MSNKLKNYLQESSAYRTLEDIEKLNDEHENLTWVPMLPLYFSLKEGTEDQIVETLPKLDQKQRQSLIDIDGWDKDSFDIYALDRWCALLSYTKNVEVIDEFVRSNDFKLYLKGRFNIYTFDVENPLYPDHDNFFTTDDDSFLFEFESDFKFVDEVKYLIKNLYASLGVEKANEEILTLISDSFLVLQEEAYDSKKDRLRDFGYVDYFEALELKQCLGTKALSAFIKSKLQNKGLSPQLENEELNQTHFAKVVSSFQVNFESILDELELVEDEKRMDYLQFNFNRLINATLVLSNAFKNEEISTGSVGEQSKQRINLALSYLKARFFNQLGNQSTFEYFDFYDLYLIGNSLLESSWKQLKHWLLKYNFTDKNKYFLGDRFNLFIEDIEANGFKIRQNGRLEVIDDFERYQIFQNQLDLVFNLVPIVDKFRVIVTEIKRTKRSKSFFRNYAVSELDFEAIILTQFANYTLGNFKKKNKKKYSLLDTEFYRFFREIYREEKYKEKLHEFLNFSGLDIIDGIAHYLQDIVNDHIGYIEDSELESIDLHYISGFLILNQKSES
ncbi:MAG: hypothetical protein H6621_08490 [Halobacteriovoraceae bacterium]|nr:hypothetical protein [Halobacteriovoraceae bacterium]MCB9095090.1 hypothetical protein [Halobacteriovoraceae bacterium]